MGHFRSIYGFVFEARSFVFNTLLASFLKKVSFLPKIPFAKPISSPKSKLSSLAKNRKDGERHRAARKAVRTRREASQRWFPSK
jgi:hypothetical protein